MQRHRQWPRRQTQEIEKRVNPRPEELDGTFPSVVYLVMLGHRSSVLLGRALPQAGATQRLRAWPPAVSSRGIICGPRQIIALQARFLIASLMIPSMNVKDAVLLTPKDDTVFHLWIEK